MIRPSAPQLRRLTYRDLIVRHWRNDPEATCEQVRLATGAPHAVVRRVRRDLVDLGLLEPGPDAYA